MKSKRGMSLVLMLMMVLSLLPANSAFAAVKPQPGHREVYLHAQQEQYPTETKNRSEVYLNENMNLYFAVDDPNKGDTANGEHIEPQYDMNGYTVKIYYDDEYFDWMPTDNTSDTSRIDYTLPAITEGWDDVDTGAADDIDTVLDEEVLEGFRVHTSGKAENVQKDGKTYTAVWLTLFFQGKWVPDKIAEKGDYWYNLCALPLKPIKAGTTRVMIDIGTADPYTLELFAKDVNDDYPPNFTVSAVNNGYHTIQIKDRLIPLVPVADPPEGRYSKSEIGDGVTLTCEDDCYIMVSTDGGITYRRYTDGEKIDVSLYPTIDCYAVRSIDETKKSSVKTYTYEIIPETPLLFLCADPSAYVPPTVVPTDVFPIKSSPLAYYPSHAFWVFASDNYTIDAEGNAQYNPVFGDTTIYYTYDTTLSADAWTTGGDEAESEWVPLDKTMRQSLPVTNACTIRLMTVDLMGNKSDIKTYHFGIRPAEPDATPKNDFFTQPQEVVLFCDETPGAKIYYTLDGSYPTVDAEGNVVNGILYEKLTLQEDTTVIAASWYNGVMSEPVAFWYVFNIDDSDGITAFYPQGNYEGSVSVTLTPNDPSKTVEYKLDPDDEYKPWPGTQTYTEDTIIYARPVDEHGNPGEMQVFKYTVRPKAPDFAPPSTQFSRKNEVRITCPERTNYNADRYELYYVIGDGDPTTEGRKAGDDDEYVHQVTGYTKISAAILRDGKTWSDVVTHAYDIITSKPSLPMVTLNPGDYTLQIGGEGYVMQFVPVPTGTEIYYTISYNDQAEQGPFLYPSSSEDDTEKNIALKGKTVITAKAVNSFGLESDEVVFVYTIRPQAPILAPSAILSDDTLPLVPVRVVEGGTVKYEINGFEASFDNTPSDSEDTDYTTFYIDTNTGNAYRNSDRTGPLAENTSGQTNGNSAVVSVWSELDGISSTKTTRLYQLNTEGGVMLAAPYADKDSGTYEEINVDGENSLLIVNLYSLNSDAEIQYMLNNDGVWKNDTTSLKLKDDTVLQLRAADSQGNHSDIVTYVYNFVPLSPIIKPASGRYTQGEVDDAVVSLDPRVPTDKRYVIWFRANGGTIDEIWSAGNSIEIDHTMSIRAYVQRMDQSGSLMHNKISENTINYYIVEPPEAASGEIYIDHPYYVEKGGTKYISTHLLDDTLPDNYAKGIQLLTKSGKKIKYDYTYTSATSGNTVVDVAANYEVPPVVVNSSIKTLTIHAQLINDDGSIDEASEAYFNYVFWDLGVPETTIGESKEVSDPTDYSIINKHNDPYTLIYYTTDPAVDPKDVAEPYDGTTLQITEDTTLRTRYYRACGDENCPSCRSGKLSECPNGQFGDLGEYTYTTLKPTYSGGGGGGGGRTIDKTRKYTKDIFGNEHPTHISYINGYPDGSVRPNGQITREEIAAVLYRIKNHAYDEPFIVTGEVFPDVKAERWSVKEIEYMVNDGVIYGYPDGEFKPTGNLTRAEFAALICRFAELDAKNGENIFPDISEEHWAYNDVMALYQSGLLEGYEDGTFKPENQITRAEVMTVINKLLGRCPSEEYVKSLNFNPYNDLEIDKWYYVTVLEATITHNYYLDVGEKLEIKWEDWK